MNKFFSKHGLRILFTVLVVYGLFTSLILYKIIVKKEPVKDMVMTSARQVVLGEQVKDLEIKEIPDESRIELLDTDYESLLDMYGMPPLARMEAAEAQTLVDNLLIMKRVHNLGYEESDFLTPEKSYKLIYTDVADYMDNRDYGSYYEFDGQKISELNDFMKGKKNAYIKLTTLSMDWDETLIPVSNVTIDAAGVVFTMTKELDKAVHIVELENVALRNFVIEDGVYNWGIFVVRSTGISIEDTVLNNAACKALVVLGQNKYLDISRCSIDNSGNGSIILNGDISRVIFESNTITNTKGTPNFSAAVVITSIPIPDYNTAYNPFVEEPICDRYDSPHEMVVLSNYVFKSNSSGIYSDGSYCNYFIDNTLYLNDKEGMCLDAGSFGNYVSGNTIKQNGGRRRQTLADLENDFVQDFGTLSDGSSPAKLPGLSIDNSAYNIVMNNYICDNYGSGVKMVRVGVRNIIADNVIANNNRGQSENFHFFGIELGYAAKPDYETVMLDFAACYENIICRNIITGEHYAGIFMAEECYINDFYDNVIMDAVFWSMESLSSRFNATSNNLSDISSRGIDLSNTNGGIMSYPAMTE